MRARATKILANLAEQILDVDETAEFARYAEPTGILCETREQLKQVPRLARLRGPSILSGLLVRPER